MSTFKARGVVLKETPAGECDKLLTLLLKGMGKVTASAKGARRPTSKYLAGTQLFTYADFVIYDGGRFNSVTQIDIIEGFYEIRNDFDRLCYGTYFLELMDKVLLSGEDCDDFLLLLISALSALAKGQSGPGITARAFELKFLQLSGYEPELSCCSHCGMEMPGDFYFAGNGCVCSGCKSGRAFTVSAAAVAAMRYIMESEIRRAFSFSVSPEVYAQLKQAAQAVMSHHLEVSPKSLALLGE